MSSKGRIDLDMTTSRKAAKLDMDFYRKENYKNIRLRQVIGFQGKKSFIISGRPPNWSPKKKK